MKALRVTENLLHVGGCVVLLYGVTVTVFIIAAFTDSRPFGLHPIQFGLIFAAAFTALGSVLLIAAGAIRKRSPGP